MSGISFSHPLLVLLALVPGVLLALQTVLSSHTRAKVGISSYGWISGGRREPILWLRLAWLLRFLATLCLVLVLAGLRVQRRETVPEDEHSAVMVVLDTSSSMTAEDFAPQNRLEEAKKHLAESVSTHATMEIGLIQFAAAPVLLVPATCDHAALLDRLRQVRPAEFGQDGTAIGSAIASALNRLREGPWGRRMILLITDGVSNRGPLAPLDAARIAKILKIPIYTIGLGTDAVARFWVPTPQGQAAEMQARIEIDDDALRMLASETGGEYRRVRNSEELHRALLQLPLQSADSASKSILTDDPSRPRSIASLALMLLALEFFIAHFVYAELPG